MRSVEDWWMNTGVKNASWIMGKAQENSKKRIDNNDDAAIAVRAIIDTLVLDLVHICTTVTMTLALRLAINI